MVKIAKIIAITFVSLILIILVSGLGIYGYTKYQITSHERFWKETAAKQMPPNAIVYVALGDSTAQAIGSPDPMQGYVGQFATRVSEQTGRPVHIINISKTGAIAKDVLIDQAPKVSKYNPEIVTIAIGGNDVLADTDQRSLFNDIKQIAEVLPEGTFIADLPTFERGTQRDMGIASRAYVQQLAKEYNLIYVPINEATEPKFWDIDQYAIDFLHPSVKQYTIWADTFWEIYQQSTESGR
jgi:lysophospholipase L1-like esterase